MSQPKILNSQTNNPGLFDGGTYGWNDLTSSLSSGKSITATDPDWVVFRNGIYAYSFPASGMTELWISFHINHFYKEGTVMYPHIHWTTSGTNTGVVRWGVEYTLAKGYNRQPFPTSTTVYLQQAAPGIAYQHMIAEDTVNAIIPATDLEPDAIIMMRIFRDANHANDTCTDAAFGLQADIHFQVDNIATVNRNYPFS